MKMLVDENAIHLVYIASASQDEHFRKALEKHLALFVKQNRIRLWHRHQTPPGTDAQQIGEAKLSEASIILLLMSADFIDECYAEMEFAISSCPSALVIPILLRAVNLQDTPFERLQCLPRNGPPIDECGSRDKAFQEIVSEIREALAAQISPQKKQRGEKERRLQALLADHHGFVQDRLASFVGRQSELTDIQQHISNTMRAGGYVTITGQAGQGKSSIIAKLVELAGQESENIAYHFIPLNPGPDHQVGLLRNLMARLILKYGLSDLYVASDSRAALRDYFPKVLHDIVVQGKQEVIFIDGLDQLEEDLNGFRDLSFLPTNPPAGIAFVLGTRPDDTLRPLELLKPFEEYRLPNLSREDFDLILAHRHIQLERGLADQFYTAMEQNALYLDLVAKELLEAGALPANELIAHLAHNPNNLFSLSIARFKRQHLEWREVLKPLLGLLLAAREPLGPRALRSILQIDDERLRDGIQRLGGLLIDIGRQYTLYHLKLRDYLRQNEQNLQQEYVFAKDEEESWHVKLAIWCEQGGLASIWENTRDASEQERRLYARKHVIAHWYFARQHDRLFAILDEGSYGRAKERYDVSARSYIEDLDYGRRASIWNGWKWNLDEALQNLPRLWRYTLLRCSLRSQADYPIALFQLLLLSGREQEVIGHAELLTDPVKKATVFLLIAKYLSMQPDRQTESQQFLLRTHELARTVVTDDQQTAILSLLAGLLIGTGQWEYAEEIAHGIPWSLKRAGILNVLAKALAEAQLWQQAEAVWKEARDVAYAIPQSDQRDQVLREIAEALGRTKHWEQAEEIAYTILGSDQQANALHALAKALARNQQWERAEDVVHTISRSYQRAKALNMLAKALARGQRWEQAEVLWKEAAEIARTIAPPSSGQATTLSEIAKELAEAQRWEQAEALWKEAAEIARTISYVHLQARTLSEIAKELAQVQLWEQAEALWKEAAEIAHTIPQSGLQCMALSVLTKALCSCQRWEWAVEVAHTIPQINQQAEALSEIVKALAQAQHWKRAEEIARTIPQGYLQAEALSELGIALIKKRQYNGIESLCTTAEEMVRAVRQSDKQAEALSQLAKALVRSQWRKQAEAVWKEAEKAARTIPHEFQQAEALHKIVEELAQTQCWEQAEEVARFIPRSYQQARALCKIAKKLAQEQHWERAETLWKEAEKVASTIPMSDEQMWALSEIAHDLTQARRWEQAERVARTISWSDQQAEALVKIVSALAQEQHWEQAEEIARSISQGDHQARALCEIIEGLVQKQRWEQAEALWKNVEKVASTISDFAERMSVLSMLAKLRAKEQKWEQAEALWKDAEEVAYAIPKSNLRASALGILAALLAQEQRWEWAEEIARTIPESDEKALALCEIAECLVQEQRWEQAEALCVDVKGAAGTIHKSDDQARVLSVLASILVKAQRWEQAERIARSISESKQQASALSALVEALAKAQRWEQAEEVARTISESDEQASALNHLIDHLFEQEEYERGYSLVERSLLQAETRTFALKIFYSAVKGLVPLKPNIGIAFYQEFQWVDTFLSGKVR